MHQLSGDENDVQAGGIEAKMTFARSFEDESRRSCNKALRSRRAVLVVGVSVEVGESPQTEEG